LLAGLSRRLITVNKRIADMTGSAESRLARLFVTLAGRVGVARGDGVFVPLPLSRQEVADLIGTTLETAIRLMSRWQKDEIVMTEKSGFLIPAVDALKSMTSEGLLPATLRVTERGVARHSGPAIGAEILFASCW